MSTSLAKKEIMATRKPRAIALNPELNKSQQIYSAVKDRPGYTRSEYQTLLVYEGSPITPKDISNAFIRLVERGYIREGRGKGKNDPVVYHPTDLVYVPEKIRKIAPTDKKALKSASRALQKAEELFKDPVVESAADPIQRNNVTPIKAMRKVKPAPVKPELVMIQGLAVIDPSSEHFAEEVREQSAKMGIPAEIAVAEGPTKPIATMFFEVGNQTLMATPLQAHQLYKELHAVFGQK